MRFIETALKGLFVIEAEPIRDARGFFSRVFCEKEFRMAGHDKRIVQINHSMTLSSGAIRGMHYQKPPRAEIKVVKCLQGRVFDVAVDLREGSSTFLKWYGMELSAEKMNALYIPEGFAHGFQTLQENCQMLYMHSEFYDPAHEAALRYNDPLVGIQWPLEVTEISKKDKEHPFLTRDFRGVRV